MAQPLVIESTRNADVKIYHVRVLLSQENAVLYLMMPSTRKALTPIGVETSARIATIPGVVDFSINRYSLHVTKGGVFRWEEIDQAIREVFDATE